MGHRTQWERGLLGFALLLALAANAWCAPVVKDRVLEVDLEPGIAAAINKPERFAVDVLHIADFRHDGAWERVGGVSTWRYRVRIPGAVSMSFHASSYRLPLGASLTVSDATGASFTYSPDMGGEGGLWSRLSRGDTLEFELRVGTADETRAEFSLASLQAGYRLLGGGGPDHPYYRKLHSQRAFALSTGSCTKNFECYSTPENSRNADATAALVIGGVALCTGTLINNQRSDGTPYMLTARHCQDTPYSGVVVYWDAAKPCGQVLGTVFDTDTPAYLHTTDTVFEQQDVWLIHLTGPINAARVYFAGWDASGAAFTGGYSPHHALGRSRQYAEWFGQAAAYPMPRDVLGVGYDATYWGVVNSIGNIGSGASGGGLFNPQHRLVGTLSLAYLDDSGEGVCPVDPPPEPSTSSAVALYDSLSAVWDTNDDTTSYTNPVRLKSLLDPDNTGIRVVDGFGMLSDVYITVNSTYGFTGSPLTLTWNGGTATSCTASGGTSGDGWAGPRAPNGTFDVTSYGAGTTSYSIRCTDGTRFADRSVRVEWNAGAPSVFMGVAESSGFLGATIHLVWQSNLTPCVASGGVPGDGWAGSRPSRGSLDLPATQAGVTNYTLTCGSGARQAAQSAMFTAFAPVATLEALSNNMRVGSQIIIMQSGGGVSCARTGGVPGDGWAGSTENYPARVTSLTPGTFHYKLECSGGPMPVVAELDLTWTNAAPSATLTASKPSAYAASGPIGDFSGTSPYVIEFSWVSNVAPCQLSYDGPGNEDGPANPAMDHPGVSSVDSAQSVTGMYLYRVTCTNGSDTSTATTTVEFLPPPASVYVNLETDTPAANEALTIDWYSNISPCVGSGGVAGDGWNGPQGNSGVTTFTLQAPGTYTYTMSCGAGSNVVSASKSFTIGAPAVYFEPHPADVVSGTGVILRYHSTVGPCHQTGDWAAPNDFPANGANVVVYGGVGVQTYGIRCGAGTVVEATTQVNYRARPSVDIVANVDHASVNQPVTLSWTSQNATHCAVQGTGSDDWNGDLPTAGSQVVTRSTPGTVGFYITCDDSSDAVVVEWRAVVKSPPTPPGPTLSFSIDHTSRQSGDPVSLTWTTTRAAVCHGSQGVNGDNWAGTLPVSGTRTYIVTGTGTVTWGLTCDGAPPSATASVSAIYTGSSTSPPPSNPPPQNPPSSGSSGGGGGGGSVDPVLLAALALLLGWIRIARPCTVRHSS